MKKKIFSIATIIILIIIIVIIYLNDNTKSIIDFNTDLKISTKETQLNATIQSYSNNSYAIDTVKTTDLDNETEEKIVDVAYNMTKALNDIENNNYVANLYKYFKRIPSEKIGTKFYSDIYKEWSNDYITLSSVAYVLQLRSLKYEEITGYNITYASSERYLIQIYIDNYKGYYGRTEINLDAIFEYEVIYEDISSMYKVSRLSIEWIKDLEKYYTENDVKERTQNKTNTSTYSNVSTYIPEGYTNFDYSKLEKVTTTETNQVYNKNKNSVVIIDSVTENGVTSGSASGFFIRSGVIVTSYDSVYSMLENGAARFYAVDVDDKVNEIEGIVAAYPNINIIVLKLKEEVGTKVTIGDSSQLEANDPIVVISSSLGLKASIKMGIYFDYLNDDYKIIRTSLPLIDGDSGSAVFNLSGEVIAINTSVSSSTSKYNSGLNNATDISILKSVISKLNNEKFKEIETTKFSDLTKEEELKVINNVNDKIWSKYEELPVITNYVPLNLYSAYINNDYLIVRYKQETYSALSNDNVIEVYTKYLVLNSYTKISMNVYQKDNITIRLKDNLGYIIVIVEGVV